MRKTGVWLIGAQGSLASTVVLGARAVARGLATGHGLVTELPELTAIPLVAIGDLAFGGWDLALAGRASAPARSPVTMPRSRSRWSLSSRRI